MRLLNSLTAQQVFTLQREAGQPVFPLLDPPETNAGPSHYTIGGESPPRSELAESFRHSGWQHARDLVYVALQRTGQSPSRLLSFADCGAYAFIYQSLKTPYEYRVGGSSCRDRFCVPCAKDRSRVLASNVLNALGDRPVRFLTLTLRSNDLPLSEQVDRLYRSFSLLRNRAFWHKRVSGGCAFTEIKWSQNSQAWNVHIHCMLHGLYLPKSDVWRAWHAITGDSMIVDIRIVRSHATIARYVTKYVSKPLDNSFLNRQPQFDELIQAMRGRRLCITFGDWRGIKLTESPEPGEWLILGSFDSVLRLAKQGDKDALNAVHSLCGPLAQAYIDTATLPRAPPSPRKPSSRQLLLRGLPTCGSLYCLSVTRTGSSLP